MKILNRNSYCKAVVAAGLLLVGSFTGAMADDVRSTSAAAVAARQAGQGSFAASLAAAKSKAPGQRASEFLSILRAYPELNEAQKVELLSLAGEDALKTDFGTTLLPMISASYMSLDFDEDAGEVFDKYLTLTLEDPDAARLLAEVYAGQDSLSILDWVIPPLEAAAGAMRDPINAAYTHVAISRLHARRGEAAEARSALARATASARDVRDEGRARLVHSAIAKASAELRSASGRT